MDRKAFIALGCALSLILIRSTLPAADYPLDHESFFIIEEMGMDSEEERRPSQDEWRIRLRNMTLLGLPQDPEPREAPTTGGQIYDRQEPGSRPMQAPGDPFYESDRERQRLYEQQREPGSRPGQRPEGGGDFSAPERERQRLESERQRLHAPPRSLEPRRDGPSDPRLRPQQPGPRRFAPTPDMNGGGSPFDFDRHRLTDPSERPRR